MGRPKLYAPKRPMDIGSELSEAIYKVRWDHKMPSEAEAIRRLLTVAIEALEKRDV
jgi:hypothetical protein